MANGRKSEFHNFVYTPKEDRYSAIPSYSLQSHVAEGNYPLVDDAERVPGSRMVERATCGNDPEENILESKTGHLTNCLNIRPRVSPCPRVMSDIFSKLECWRTPLDTDQYPV